MLVKYYCVMCYRKKKEGDEADSNADANEALKDGYDGTRFLLLFVSVSGFSSGLPDLTFFSSCFVFLSSFNSLSFCSLKVKCFIKRFEGEILLIL